MDSSHATVPKTLPSSDEQVKTSSSSSSVSHHSIPDSDKPPASLAKLSKAEGNVNMNTEDILRARRRCWRRKVLLPKPAVTAQIHRWQ